MKRTENGASKAKLRSSYVTLVVSVSLVLFLLGILGLVLINARELSDYFRESLSLSVMLDDASKEADIRMLQKDLDAKAYIKSTKYVSKDEAAANMKEELGEDFISFLGDNPLPPSIDVYLVSNYANPDSAAKIEKYIQLYPFVKDVIIPESLLSLINENVKKISLFLLVISAFPFSYCTYNNKQHNKAFNLFKKIPDKDHAACWSNALIHKKTVHCAGSISWIPCRADSNDSSDGPALSY